LQFARIALISAGVLWTTVVDLGAHEGSKDWTVLENCRLIVNPANDGDSFHVSAGRNEYIFRLYLVDALETDEMTPGRLVAQAKYFGITVPQAIEVGRAAKEFTREKLSAAFTVLTHMSDAMGQSRLERFYAFVQTKEGDLGEQLVRNGLARNYGFKAVPPGLRNWRVEMEKLQRLENEARQEKIGGWGVNIGRLNAPAGAPAPFSHFGSNQKLQGTWNGYSFALVFVNTQTARTNCAWRHTQSRTSRIQKQTGHLLRSPSIQRQRKN
jgi:endonuclease YncB( thermonuclease family)